MDKNQAKHPEKKLNFSFVLITARPPFNAVIKSLWPNFPFINKII